MKLEIYKCDFCKENVEENQLNYFNLGLKRYEVCKTCYTKAKNKEMRYDCEQGKLYDEFEKEIEALIKEERN